MTGNAPPGKPDPSDFSMREWRNTVGEKAVDGAILGGVGTVIFGGGDMGASVAGGFIMGAVWGAVWYPGKVGAKKLRKRWRGE